MIGEKLPTEFTEVYTNFNGEKGNSNGILFRLEFITMEKIISQLDFSLSLVKPKERIIIDQNQSGKILNEISDIYFKAIPNKKKFGSFAKEWEKAKFECSYNSHTGILVDYGNGKNEYYVLNSVYSNKIFALVKKIHKFGKDVYNRGNLAFELKSNGEYTIERKDCIFENVIDFSSCPSNCIKKKYFHFKWLPLFHDFNGNFIGIDLDPDKNGTKGQIITFGRDEHNMVVIANNLEKFLDLTIKEINKFPRQFITEYNIFKVYKRIKNCTFGDLIR